MDTNPEHMPAVPPEREVVPTLKLRDPETLEREKEAKQVRENIKKLSETITSGNVWEKVLAKMQSDEKQKNLLLQFGIKSSEDLEAFLDNARPLDNFDPKEKITQEANDIWKRWKAEALSKDRLLRENPKAVYRFFINSLNQRTYSELIWRHVPELPKSPANDYLIQRAIEDDADFAVRDFRSYRHSPWAMDILRKAIPHITSPMPFDQIQRKDFFLPEVTEREKKQLLSKVSDRLQARRTLQSLAVDREHFHESELARDPGLQHLQEVREEWIPSEIPPGVEKERWTSQMRAMIARNLFFQNGDISRDTVKKEHARIMEKRKLHSEVALFSKRNVILAAHNELHKKDDIDFYHLTDTYRFGKEEVRKAIREQQKNGGSLRCIRPENNSNSLKKAKEEIFASIRNTKGPLTFLFDGHGGPEGLYLCDGVPDNGKIHETESTIKISPKELAEAFKARPLQSKKDTASPNPQEKDMVIFASCYNSDFIRAFYAALGDYPKPIALGESEYGHLDIPITIQSLEINSSKRRSMSVQRRSAPSVQFSGMNSTLRSPTPLFTFPTIRTVPCKSRRTIWNNDQQGLPRNH